MHYLHQLLPGVLTCVVGKRLASGPAEDHWSLRDQAAASTYAKSLSWSAKSAL